jgi:hypothetical protein
MFGEDIGRIKLTRKVIHRNVLGGESLTNTMEG